MNAVEEAPRQLRFLTRRQVEDRCGISRSSIYRRIGSRTFPAPVRDQETGAVWWLEHEIEAWMLARIANRDGAQYG